MAGFVGETNLLEGVVVEGVRAGEIQVRVGGVTLTAMASAPVGASVELSLRPEVVRFVPEPRTTNSFCATVSDVTYLGGSTRYVLATPMGRDLLVRVQATGARLAAVDDQVAVAWDVHDLVVLGDEARASGQRGLGSG